MPTPCIVILTTENTQTILKNGGTQHWRVGEWRRDHNSYVVCVRNGHHVDNEGPEPHGTGFLIGKISDFVWTGVRYRIEISAWAPLDIPDCWMGDRYPVRYRNLEDLGIDPESLEFRPVERAEPAAEDERTDLVIPADVPPKGLTLAEAKSGLAIHLGVSPEAIEITIRA